MSAAPVLIEVAEDKLNRITTLNDLGIEYWMRNDLVNADRVFARALNLLRSLGRVVVVAMQQQAPVRTRDDCDMTLCAPIKIGRQEHPGSIYDRVFLLTNSSIRWSLRSVKVVAAAVFYHVGLFNHLRVQRVGGSLPNNGHRSVVRYYEKANHLLGRYMDATRSPLWLFQAALWHNTALCYKQRALFDPIAVYVYLDQIKAIVNWIKAEERSFFKGAILVTECQQGARVIG